MLGMFGIVGSLVNICIGFLVFLANGSAWPIYTYWYVLFDVRNYGDFHLDAPFKVAVASPPSGPSLAIY
jgi:hypothetical protein